ncbi:MAG: Flp family type IVb pilin [Ignavibacteriales bacterium]
MASLYWVLRRFIRDERGQGMAEYGLILFLVAIVAMTALSPLGGRIRQVFLDVTSGLGGGS